MLLPIYKEWFRFHSLPQARADRSWNRCDLDGQILYFTTRLVESNGSHPYRLILGYAVVNNQLQGRLWYYSGSEATWRVFTGWRIGGEWTKGAEYLPDTDPKKNYTSLGYIFECFTTADLNQALEVFWSKGSIQKSQHLYPWEEKIVSLGSNKTYMVPPDKSKDDFKIFKYLVGDYSEHEAIEVAKKKGGKKPPEICTIFNEDRERQFVMAGLPNMDRAAQDITTKVASVKMQNPKFGLTKSAPVEDYPAVLKKETALNQWLIDSMLKGPFKSSQHWHPVLDQNYTVYSYKLKPEPGFVVQRELILEIAVGNDFKNHEYLDWSNKKRLLMTPVCWVRDVYFPDTKMNSFGSRKEIPINTAFLVQKPCDYQGQILDDHIKLISFNTNLVNKKYMMLSMRNEETLPIILKFKIRNRFPVFEHDSGDKVVIEGKLDELKAYVILGISEYQSLQAGTNPSGYSNKGHHSTSGKTRATQLKEQSERCKTSGQLNQVLYDCFINNRVGTFTGNSFFSSVNTNPTSLFTCVCRKLLGQFVRLGDEVEASRLKKNDKSRYGGYVGPQGSLNRLIHYVQTTPVPENTAAELFITNEAANLLKAIKG